MAKRASKTKKGGRDVSPKGSRPASSVARKRAEPSWVVLVPALLAALTFWVYWPSLKSAFVYDAKGEILQEGFITSLSNLPAVLSLKVLGSNLLLAGRPGQMLFMMLNAAVWGKEPWGYHLASNVLHAANVALLYLLIRRLLFAEWIESGLIPARRLTVALVVPCLIFALHPISVETVSEINYSSDLLVTFFFLAALLTAAFFRADDSRSSGLYGALGVGCAFASVTCKESGMATALLLVVYWLLFRWKEAKGPWLLFLGAALAVTFAFLFARFYFAPSGQPKPQYLGGSIFGTLAIQPRLWVFMIGKLLCPINLSADYTLENIAGLSLPMALVILAVVLFLQGLLATKSRLGVLGAATFWLGLATVSNFMPLYRIVGDRFYYLPLAGVSMELVAVLFLLMGSRYLFWIISFLLTATVVPFVLLTLHREDVFADEFSLWSDTARVSPFSATAHSNLGVALLKKGDPVAAELEHRRAIAINPNMPEVRNSLGIALFHQGRIDEAINEYQKAVELNPKFAEAFYDLGNALLQKRDLSDAMEAYQKALELDPDLVEGHNNLGVVFFRQDRVDDAMAEYEKALEIDPTYVDSEINLGKAYMKKGQLDDAIACYQKTLELDPTNADAQSKLASALAQKGDEK